ncbi:hypothetical protein HNR06_004447 [Nocardiopsis arvandica]|uniref:Uncharacterized protein n=1 Tax=Nocardiopsis sinuspersici TaxID=501010 RepID=A0A7Z0BKH5_9ACTN|nr:hypothetical protein [Nocardiopsis sinuspersici]
MASRQTYAGPTRGRTETALPRVGQKRRQAQNSVLGHGAGGAMKHLPGTSEIDASADLALDALGTAVWNRPHVGRRIDGLVGGGTCRPPGSARPPRPSAARGDGRGARDRCSRSTCRSTWIRPWSRASYTAPWPERCPSHGPRSDNRLRSTEAGIQRYPTFLGSGVHHYDGQATERRSIRKETADYAFLGGSRGVCAPLVLSMNSSARQTREEQTPPGWRAQYFCRSQRWVRKPNAASNSHTSG